MTYIEVSILLLCDHDCDGFFSGEPCCCSCLLELLLAKDLLGLLTAQDVLVFLIAKALMPLLVALALLELLHGHNRVALLGLHLVFLAVGRSFKPHTGVPHTLLILHLAL